MTKLFSFRNNSNVQFNYGVCYSNYDLVELNQSQGKSGQGGRKLFEGDSPHKRQPIKSWKNVFDFLPVRVNEYRV